MPFRRFSFSISSLLIPILISGCMYLWKPRKDIGESKSLLPPNYEDLFFWASHPDKKDPGDEVPEGSVLKDRQMEAPADVFFVHPTTLLVKPKYWNGDLRDESLNDRTDAMPIRTQASVFNDCCRIYAPRYRQAALIVFMENVPESNQALDLAYEDVKAAFLYYMKHRNKGRPWILASHSQGTRHSVRLLKEIIRNSEYSKNFVAAYSIGFPYSASDTGFLACTSELQTGCVINWNSYEWGSQPIRLGEKYDSNTLCINPLTWKMDQEYAPRSANAGSIGRNFRSLVPGIADAQCNQGALWVHEPEIRGFPSLGKDDSLHLVDYHLFYASIRKNAGDRVAKFLSAKKD